MLKSENIKLALIDNFQCEIYSLIFVNLFSRRSKHTVIAYKDAVFVFGGDNG